MSRWSRLLTAAAVWLCGTLSAHAVPEFYTGEYGWLSFYHTQWSNSPAYYLKGTPGMAFLGTNFGNNAQDVFRQVTWAKPVVLNSARVSTWHQLGTGGSIGPWRLQFLDNANTWQDVPTLAVLNGDTGNGFGHIDVNFTSPVNTTALRVLFEAGTYTVGTSNVFSGPGVAYIQARGNQVGGIRTDDREFNVIATNGILAATPTVTFTDTAPANGGEFAGGNLVDKHFGFDGARAGFYPAVTATDEIILDLKTVLSIKNVRLFGGSFYTYLPTSVDVMGSLDGVTFGPVAGTLTSLSESVVGAAVDIRNVRYLKFTNFSAGSYVLPNEIFVAIPEPMSAAMLTLGGLAAVRRRRS